MTRTQLASLGVACLIVFFSALLILSVYRLFPSVEGAGDVSIYRDISVRVTQALSGEIQSINSEYPPLATALFAIVGKVASLAFWSFPAAWVSVIAGMILSSILYCWIAFSRRDALLLSTVALFALPLLSAELVLGRFDVYVMLTLFLSWRAHVAGKYRSCAAFLTFAIALKLVPVLVVPFLFFATPKRKRMDLIIGAMIGILITVGSSMVLLDVHHMVDNTLYMLKYHGDRAVQIESTWSGLHMLFLNLLGQKVQTGLDHMSVSNTELTSTITQATKILMPIGLLILFIRFIRLKIQKRDYGKYLLSALCWSLFISPVLSPQYFVWIVPVLLAYVLEAIADQRLTRRMIGIGILTIILAYATQWIYPRYYQDFLQQTSLFHTIVLNIRNVSILAIAILLLKERDSAVRPRGGKKFKLKRLLTFFAIDTCLLLIAGFLFVQVRPMFLSGTGTAFYRFNERLSDVTATRLPVSVGAESSLLHVQFPYTVSALHGERTVRIKADDCLEWMNVNGRHVDDTLGRFCTNGGWQRVDLRAYLQPGENSIELLVRDFGGNVGVDMAPGSVHPFVTAIILLFLATVVWYVYVSAYVTSILSHKLWVYGRRNIVYNRLAKWKRLRTHRLISTSVLRQLPASMSI